MKLFARNAALGIVSQSWDALAGGDVHCLPSLVH